MNIFRTDETRTKVIFINRFFFPDHSATSQILSDLAFHLASEGRPVLVITSRQRYDDPEAELVKTESIKGVHVHRVATSHFGRAALVGRALDYFSFYLSSCWKLWRLARRGDIVVAETDPPLLSVVVAPIVRIRRAKLVNWLQDLFPEVASALGVRLVKGRLGRWISHVRDASLRFASMNVVLGDREKAFLLRRGVPAERITLIHNWSDDEAIQPLPPVRNALRTEWGLEGKFVVEYSGNLGRAHDVDTIIEAAALLLEAPGQDAKLASPEFCPPAFRDACPLLPRQTLDGQAEAAHCRECGDAVPNGGSRDIVLLFIGGGHRYEWLQQESARRGLTNLMFRPYQPRERLVESLGLGDLHLISLLPEMEGLIVPSKFYGIASAGRPMAFIGDPDGEIGRMVSAGSCGVTIPPGDAARLAGWIRRLHDYPKLRERWGANARALLDAEFTQEKAFDAWQSVVE